jgi:hypothetical protein
MPAGSRKREFSRFILSIKGRTGMGYEDYVFLFLLVLKDLPVVLFP